MHACSQVNVLPNLSFKSRAWPCLLHSLQVYVLGDRTVVTKRPSLGDKYLDKEARRSGVMHLPRISCKVG